MSRQFPALRGIAILLVVLNHSIGLSLLAVRQHGYPPPAAWERYVLLSLKGLGLIAVPTFLFLSGCFVVYAVQGKTLPLAYKTVWAGLKHILSPYLIWSVAFYVMIYFMQGEQFTWLEYLKNLAVGYPFNFVPLLIFFYLLAPLMVPLAARYPWLVLGLVGLYQLFTANVLKPGLVGVAFPDWAQYLTLPGLRTSVAIWGLYFPLGVIYSLHSQRILAYLIRLWPLLLAAALVALGLAILTDLSVVNVPLAELLCPVPFILLFPLIKRDAIPGAQHLEQLGKKSFGLYLTNLIALNLALASIQLIMPWLFTVVLLLVPIVFSLTIALPRLLMRVLERWPNPGTHRYVFG